MLEYWKANVDITIIIDYHAAVSYLTKYISKPESKGREMQKLFRDALINAPDTANPQSRLRSIMIKSIEGKNISKFEATRQLMGGKLWSCTSSFVKLPLEIGTRVMSRNNAGEIEVEETLIFYFKHRRDPEFVARINDPLDAAHNLPLDLPRCFQEFASKFTLKQKKNPKNGFKIGLRPQNVDTVFLPRPYFSGLKSGINYPRYCVYAYIRYGPWDTAVNGEVATTEQLNDTTLSVARWESFLQTRSNEMREYMRSEMEMKNLLAEVVEDIDKERLQAEENADDEDWMQFGGADQAWASGGDVEDISYTDGFDWASRRDMYTPQQLRDALSFIDRMKASKLYDEEVQEPVTFDMLNEKQRVFFRIVEEAKEKKEQVLILLLGTAGSGKSHAVHSLSTIFDKPGSLLRCSAAAKAAFLIFGTTNHSLFKLPVKGKFVALEGPLLKAKQQEFKDVECIVIDEYACTSQEMLGWIDARCRQFKSCDEFFGGLSVVMVGDPAQLPTVGGN
jgi:hypothetical protein